MSEISTLGYVVCKAKNLDEWEGFAKNILGLQIGERSDDALALRMDERALRVLIERGDDDDLVALGWELETSEALEARVKHVRERGVEVVEASAEVARSRRVERLCYCVDPNGVRHEFAFGPTLSPISEPFNSPLLAGPGFETGRLGVGHVLEVARDYAQSVSFFTDVIGLRISDYIRDSGVFPGVTVDATFLHAATGRHHSLATASMPSPKKINHLMIQVKSLDDVGLAYDRARRAGVPIIMELGHHPNDQMVSFYAVTPSGFGIEYGWGGIVIPRDEWTVRNYSQLSDWGHRFALAPAAA